MIQNLTTRLPFREVTLAKKALPRRLMSSLAGILFHVALVALSAGIAFSLPMTVGLIAQNFLRYWSLIEPNKIYLISLETAFAILLILFFNYMSRSWKDRKMSKTARGAVESRSRADMEGL